MKRSPSDQSITSSTVYLNDEERIDMIAEILLELALEDEPDGA